ncbi:MAG: hypothetical protein AAGG59_09985 [Bacteroidota bacterium]
MVKINFLFWNINNQLPPFETTLLQFVQDEEIDILILSENKNIVPQSILNTLGLKSVDLKLSNKTSKWVQVFYRENDNYKITHHSQFTETNDDNKSSFEKTVNRIQVFKITGKVEDTFFACIHFPSKLQHDEVTHLQIVPNYKEKVETLTQMSDRLFIVGDFNMNPYDHGMVEPAGFYAHNNRDLLVSDDLHRLGRNRKSYYNPCWSLLGDYVNKTTHDQSKRTGGSFYFKTQKSRNVYWHLIDQIIMRKTLIDEFNSEFLQIIENDNLIMEVKRVRKKNETKLDHFPLKFSFSLKQN